MNQVSKSDLLIGWNEWCALPQLKTPYIKAKIDTGAKTSSLHAFNLQKMMKNNKPYVRFSIYPIQGRSDVHYTTEAEIFDERIFMSSTGHKEQRFVIKTELRLQNRSWQILLSLSKRDLLQYRMLLGREALKHGVQILPGKQCLLGAFKKKDIEKYYKQL